MKRTILAIALAIAPSLALVVSLVTAAFAIYLTLGLDWTNGSLQLVEKRDWIPSFGISWGLGVDGVSAVLIVMATLLVPLVIVDGYGNRIGYGKGFYDRYLSSCRAEAVKIGFSYFEPVGRIKDISQFDVPLNLCITPLRIYEF